MSARALISEGIALGLVFCFLSVPAVRSQQEEAAIVILSSQDALPYKKVAEGFRNYLQGKVRLACVDMYDFQGDPGRAADAVEAIKAKGGKRLILTLGSLATRTAAGRITDMPIVATLIVRLEGLEYSENLTAVVLEFPVETQLEWIRRLLPGARTVGVMYNPEENRSAVEAAARYARGVALTLEAEEIASPAGLPPALSRLANKVDVLWGLPDRVVMCAETAKPLLLFCFRNKIPLIGPSESWVRAGALFSLEWDYEDLGVQCAEAALKILNGAKAGSIPPSRPRKVLYCLNQKTAEYMKLKVPEEIMTGTTCLF